MNENKWLTVKQASLYCYEMGLPRSTKSIRRWCQFENIEAQKRQVANTEKWFIDQASLDIKIKEELEFLRHSEKPSSQTEISPGHVPDMSTHDQTQAGISGYNRLQADMSERERTQPDRPSQPQIRDLEDQILLLKKDVEWRDQLLKDQKNANMILMDEVKGQSRYIGHLETNVLRLGGNTDQAFLAAPVPISGVSEDAESDVTMSSPEIIHNDRPNPNQGNLYTG